MPLQAVAVFHLVAIGCIAGNFIYSLGSSHVGKVETLLSCFCPPFLFLLRPDTSREGRALWVVEESKGEEATLTATILTPPPLGTYW
jgi:hypothetical protein